MKYLSIILIAALIMVSCKKEEVNLTPLTSLNVTNAVVGGKTVRPGSNKVDSATNMNYRQFTLKAGSNNIYLWQTGDSSHPYFNNTLQTNDRDIYSIIVAGDVTTTIGMIVVKESIPYRTDSTARIRVINLSPNSTP